MVLGVRGQRHIDRTPRRATRTLPPEPTRSRCGSPTTAGSRRRSPRRSRSSSARASEQAAEEVAGGRRRAGCARLGEIDSRRHRGSAPSTARATCAAASRGRQHLQVEPDGGHTGLEHLAQGAGRDRAARSCTRGSAPTTSVRTGKRYPLRSRSTRDRLPALARVARARSHGPSAMSTQCSVTMTS